MSKEFVGIMFIVVGIVYASLGIDIVYKYTLGWMLENELIKLPKKIPKDELREMLGRKITIYLYASILIIIGLFVLWSNR